MIATATPDTMLEAKSYVRIDEHGVYRVGNTRVMLDLVVKAHRDAESPETIRHHYPVLSLEEIYGSIAYYLGHQDEVLAYLQRQRESFEALRRKCDENPPAVVERLQALKNSKVAKE